MTATLAHEIRNALGSVKGFAQWVDEKLDPAGGLKVGTAAILQGTARIESLVHDLLAYSRDESYRLEAVAVGPALNRALADFEPWGGQAEVSAADGLHALADEEKLHRVLTNGIRNGIEAMGAGGTLRLSASDRGRRVEIRIDDEGPGVPSEAAERVFTPFFTTKASGTGLGLAYSRKVVEAMGGRIDLTNLGAGARLSILLPKHAGA
jgi:signal transduction histidine kinase